MKYIENESGLVISCNCGSDMFRITIDAQGGTILSKNIKGYDTYMCPKCKNKITVFKE